MRTTALLLSLLPFITAQTCPYPDVLAALQSGEPSGSQSFCYALLDTVVDVGTLREDPTYFFVEIVTNTAETYTPAVYAYTTIKDVARTTNYAPQSGRTASAFTKPLPSYVQQYGIDAVRAACSCYVGAGFTYEFYRPCEQATTTRSFSTTNTYTIGVPGPVTETYLWTTTSTRTVKSLDRPYPTACPGANGIDYIASDGSQWRRGCNTSINCYRDLGTVRGENLNGCIDKCVDYNVKLGYKQCQGVSFDRKGRQCMLINEPCDFNPNEGPVGPNVGGFDVATLKFAPDQPKPQSDYCATVSGAIPLSRS